MTLRQAVDLLQDGDTILLTPGVYTGGLFLSGRSNITIRGEGQVVFDGASGARVSNVGASGIGGFTAFDINGLVIENVQYRGFRHGVYIERGRNLTIRNSTFQNNDMNGVLTAYVSDILVENCTASNNGGHGVYLSCSGDRYRVVRNRLYSNATAGLQLNAVNPSRNSADPARDGWSKSCTVEGNLIYNNNSAGGAALQLMGVHDSLFVNNLVYDNGSGGITLFDDGGGFAYGCKNNRFWHNTVLFRPGVGRYGISLRSGSTGNQLRNNIFVSGSGPAIYAEDAVDSDYNCLSGPSTTSRGSLAAWQQATGNDQHSFEGNPALTVDHRPTASSSARDMGIQVYDRDLESNPRPQGPNPDCGCYEMGGSGPALPVPTGLRATPGNGQVQLTWNAAAGAGVAGYVLYRGTSQNGSFSALNASPITGTSHTDAGLTNGATYWYKIATVGTGGGASAQSAAVSATPSGGQGGGAALMIFDDLLRNQWRLTRSASTTVAYATTPAQGARSLSLLLPGRGAFLQLSGAALSLTGRTSLKLMVHGGTTGGQQFTLAAQGTGGRLRTVNLGAYGGAPTAGGWKEYTIPLADLGLTSSLTTLRLSTARASEPRAFLDNLRVE